MHRIVRVNDGRIGGLGRATSHRLEVATFGAEEKRGHVDVHVLAVFANIARKFLPEQNGEGWLWRALR